MIDLKTPDSEKRESRAERLQKKYLKNDGTNEWEIKIALRDISVTLALILDEMRGFKHE